MIEFEVAGPYGLKGSTMSFMDRRGRVVTKTDSKYGASFAAAVRYAALAAGATVIPKGSGVRIEARYGFLRPKGKQFERGEPCIRPDADKLGRALLDALSGVAYFDDGQVVDLHICKQYGDRFCVVVKVERSTAV